MNIIGSEAQLGCGVLVQTRKEVPVRPDVLDPQALPSTLATLVGHPLRGASWESNSIGEQVIQAVATGQALISQLQTQPAGVLEPAL
ncbi:hypothetical protein [Pseudomonas baltica]|uniref:hypothetical protein n=1 Tax=Pseudomonas baltica TaxID=2762576 RepID=UPI002896CD49|nr:hypothetical protein [Pseudomonas baltica]